MKDQDPKQSPLERYLAKRRQVDGQANVEGSAADAAPNLPPQFSTEASTPVDETPPNARTEAQADTRSVGEPQVLAKPAPFVPRFFAYLIDLFIVWAFTFPVYAALGGVFDRLTFSQYGGGYFLAVQLVTYFYFGWFYSHKGATPGKLVFGLQVLTPPNLNSERGRRPSYLRSYLRESLGKYVSGLIMFLGFLIALFNRRHRALHDFIFDTEVVLNSGERS